MNTRGTGIHKRPPSISDTLLCPIVRQFTVSLRGLVSGVLHSTSVHVDMLPHLQLIMFIIIMVFLGSKCVQKVRK